MNTPAHLLIGSAAFASPDRRGTFLWAALGSLAPDLSLYVMAMVSLFVLGISPQVVFGEYYYSDAWQAVFAIDNSFILWAVGLAVAVAVKAPRAIAFAAAGLLHIALDFPLHTHDARQHFWPVTDWVFHSPVSYWDSGAYANIVGPVALALSLGAALWIWSRFRHWAIRLVTVVLALMELLSSGIWRLVF